MRWRAAVGYLAVAAHLVQPYYISYWTALRYYGYTEQAGSTVYVVTTRRKRRLAVDGLVYRFITVNEQKFFGTRRIWIDGVAVQMAEKNVAERSDHLTPSPITVDTTVFSRIILRFRSPGKR